jgi:hypothetical protein
MCLLRQTRKDNGTLGQSILKNNTLWKNSAGYFYFKKGKGYFRGNERERKKGDLLPFLHIYVFKTQKSFIFYKLFKKYPPFHPY